MGAMRDKNGRVIGTMDEPGRGSCSLFACNRTTSDRMRMGCQPRRSLGFDEALIDEEDTKVADSTKARRILSALAGKLDIDDIGTVIDGLQKQGLLTAMEVEALKQKLDPGTESNGEVLGMSYDRAFPHANRLGPPMPVASMRATERYAPLTASEERAYLEMFPNAYRLR